MDCHGFGLQQMDDFDAWVFLQPPIDLQFSRRIDVGGTIAEYLGFQWFHDNLLANFWIIQHCAAVISTLITCRPCVNRSRRFSFRTDRSGRGAVDNSDGSRFDQIIVISIKGLKFSVKILSNQKILLELQSDK